MEVNIQLSLEGAVQRVCLDTGCTMSLVDRSFLKSLLPSVDLMTPKESITVRGIGSATHPCNKFVHLSIYFQGKAKGISRIACIKRDFHIVEKLKAKMLLGMDIIGPKQISTDIKKRIAVIGSCKNFEIDLSVIAKPGGRIRRIVRSKAKVIVGAHTISKIPIKTTILPENRDFSFCPEYKTGPLAFQHNGSLYSHLVDSNMSFVQLRNDGDTEIVLPKHTRLGVIDEIEEEGCYMIEEDSHGLAARKVPSIKMVQGQPATKLPMNGLTIYSSSDSPHFKQISQACTAFPEV